MHISEHLHWHSRIASISFTTPRRLGVPPSDSPVQKRRSCCAWCGERLQQLRLRTATERSAHVVQECARDSDPIFPQRGSLSIQSNPIALRMSDHVHCEIEAHEHPFLE